jgi:predicted hotdog family 3-hydroxylacyl-ACP dehydratase
VPGVALLAMVAHAWTSSGAPPAVKSVKGFRRVRFRALVEGAAEFDVRLVPLADAGPGNVDFDVSCGGQVAADGVAESGGGPEETSDCPAFPASPEAAAIDVEALIPHRGRMRLLNEIRHVEPGRCVARSVVLASWPFCSGGSVPPVVLVELLAQTASALIGWQRRKEEDIGGKGYLVGVRLARFSAAGVPVGTVLLSHVETERQRNNYAVFQGQVASDGKLLARVTLQAFRP